MGVDGMSNMSYCRFENTNNDLFDCLNALENNDSLSESEFRKLKSLIGYCQEIIDLNEENNYTEMTYAEYKKEFPAEEEEDEQE